MRDDRKTSGLAFALRSVAAIAILWQPVLATGELASPSAFALAMAISIATGFAADRFRLRAIPVLAILAAAPWILRVLLIVCAGFRFGPGTTSDTLVLAFDRNLLVLLLPFWWSGATAYAASRFLSFTRMEPLLNTALLIAIFLAAPSGEIAAYRQPVVLAATMASIACLEIFVLAATAPGRGKGMARQRAGSALIAASVCAAVAIFLIRPLEEKSIDKGGGLLKPELFRFDFSRILKLESEISLDDDLVLIVRKDADDAHILLRRFTLSGYDRKKGFYRDAPTDENAHPARIPEGRTEFDAAPARSSVEIEQDYYLVNFDPSAFVAMNRPARVIPFAAWDASSFQSVYSVKSVVPDALPFELSDAVPSQYSRDSFGFPYNEYELLTDFGNDPRIATLAEEYTEGLDGYWDRVQSVYERLKYGEFRYSLKPGIAADGDQLGRFLFDTRRGYCSYFAFSMTLLIRSLGIPARVAVGFYIDPESGALDFHPVRSDMAHAWVEVYFPGYGWIEYDPTSESLAEGEAFRFSSGVPPELLERLMREILDNEGRLAERAAYAESKSGAGDFLPRLAHSAATFFRKTWGVLAVAAWLLAAFSRRFGLFLSARLARRPRRAAVRLGAHALRRLSLAGFRPAAGESLGEFASRLDSERNIGIGILTDLVARARFSDTFPATAAAETEAAYRSFSAAYAREVPRPVRILLALFPIGNFRRGFRAIPMVLSICLFLLNGDAVSAQTDAEIQLDKIEAPASSGEADALYVRALKAVEGERWELAIDLLRKGGSSWPDDARFPLELGDLFAGRELYGLAWDEFRKAERLGPEDPALLYRLSNAAGRLNRDAESAEYLERVTALRPADRDAIGDLGWMYFKLHKLKEGEKFLLDAIDRLGPDRGFSMTLGTIYSDLFDYDQSKRFYLEAIADAEKSGAKTFAAVAHYNLSILESKFYRYADAFERTGYSLASADRASGHLARGELLLKRLDFRPTFEEYGKAYEIDVSPLSKINMADALLRSGRLEEARAFAEETLASRDSSWMLNFGTDTFQHRRDLHDILADVYRGLSKMEGSIPRPGILDAAGGFVRRIAFRLRSMGHAALYRRYSLEVARAYEGEGQRLDAMVNFYNAFESYPDRARVYLAVARAYETSKVGAATPTYDLEEGALLGDSEALGRAIRTLDPVWEKGLLVDAWAEYAKIMFKRGLRDSGKDAIERMYALNRGGVRQRGLRLPVSVRILLLGNPPPPATASRIGGAIDRVLRSAGFDPSVRSETGADETSRSYSPRYRLTVDLRADAAEYELSDETRGISILRSAAPLASLAPPALARFAADLADRVFIAEK